MEIKWIGSHSNNYEKGRSGKTINKIVLHWIVGTLESADVTFAKPDRFASAHYGIGDDEIHQYVNEKDTAWHASNLTVNRESIGIEHDGGWLLPDGSRFKPTEKTLQTSAKLIADICKRYTISIDREHIKIHREFSTTQCPGTLDVDRIIQLAKQTTIPEPIMITDQTKIPQITDAQGVPMEVQAIRSKLNDQTRDIKTMQDKITALEIAAQQPIPAVFTKPVATHFFELAKEFERV